MFAAILFNGFSAWWVLLCLAVGVVYALVFYHHQKKDFLFYVLFSFRTILVAMLSFLLLSPFLQLRKEQEEQPLVIIAQDNSASLPLSAKNFNFSEYSLQLKEFIKQLDSKYETLLLTFGAHINRSDTIDYSEQQTNVSQVFDYIKQEYGNKNVGAVIIASDGIINKGNSVGQQALLSKTPVYTIALGDTVLKKDIIIRNVNYNRIVYLGNEYPLEVNLSAYSASGNTTNVTVETADGQRKIQSFLIDKDDWKKSVQFQLEAQKSGMQKIKISVSSVGGEVSLQNNHQTIYIEVLEGKEKVLVLANAPHPDLNAIKQAISSNKNYEVDVFLAEEAPKNTKAYNVIVLHNLPSVSFPLKTFLAENRHKPFWFILGTAVNVSHFNQNQSIIQWNGNNTIQEYYAELNKDFFNFSLSPTTIDLFQNLPPLTGLYGQYKSIGSVEYLLSQRMGGLTTTQPLLGFVKQNNINHAFLTGEGIWRWRVENYRKQHNFEACDELITKTIQYLSVREEKRKFRAYPSKNRFTEDEAVILNAELYDDVYQPVENAEIALELKNEEGGKFSFLFAKKDKFYELNAGYLPSGEYTFVANTRFGGKSQKSQGSFLIEKLNAEYTHTTANHQVLYNMSALSGGKMFYPHQLEQLLQELDSNEKIATIIHTENSYEDLINLKWLFALLMLLLSAEWFLRKRNGLL